MTRLKERKLAELDELISKGGWDSFAQCLHEGYAEGLNFVGLAAMLKVDYGIDMSASTVRTWYREILGEPRKPGGTER